MIQLTPEQFAIREHIINVDGIVLVSAGAGCGKTFLARQLVKTLNPKTTLYTAFNKAIIVDGAKAFASDRVQCKTLHALAYKYTQPTKDIRALSYRDFPKNLSYKAKHDIKNAIEDFFVSASEDMWDFFEEYFKDATSKKQYTAVAINLIEQMLDKKLPWSFGFMLKYFHLLLVEKTITCKYDLVILDEINDTTAVSLEIFKLIDAPKKVGLGEPHQAIYGFMNLVNGFEVLKDVPVFPLTNSFRCSIPIAKAIQNIMRSEMDKTFRFVGTEDPVTNGLELYCTLTNAEIVRKVAQRIGRREPFKLLRKPADIFACSLAVLSASGGKKVYQTQYKFLEDVYEDWVGFKEKDPSSKFFGYLMTELHDQEVHSAVRLLTYLRQSGQNLFKIYEEVKGYKQTEEYTIATVYTAKGLEFETVELADEFDASIVKVRAEGGITTEEQLGAYRCFYVACSRAGKVLKNAHALAEKRL